LKAVKPFSSEFWSFKQMRKEKGRGAFRAPSSCKLLVGADPRREERKGGGSCSNYRNQSGVVFTGAREGGNSFQMLSTNRRTHEEYKRGRSRVTVRRKGEGRRSDPEKTTFL